MTTNPFVNILIAEDNDISRQMMAGVLSAQDYQIFEAKDGTQALGIIDEHPIDLALVDLNMSPMGGFEFMRHLATEGVKLPVIVITGDDATDMLVEANTLGVVQVLSKPITPDRLIHIIERFLRRSGVRSQQMGAQQVAHQTPVGHEALITRVVEMAQKNKQSGRGMAFAALVTDQAGKIIGQGVHNPAARADPVAQPEVMAIRTAAESLGRADLSDCILYCASMPTALGRALVSSVGISKVYYAAQVVHNHQPAEAEYIQIAPNEVSDT